MDYFADYWKQKQYLEYVRKREADRKHQAAYARAYQPEFRRLGGPALEAAKASCSDCKGVGHVYDRKLALYVRCHCLVALLAVEAKAHQYAAQVTAPRANREGPIEKNRSTRGGNGPGNSPQRPQPLQSPVDYAPYRNGVFTYNKKSGKKLRLFMRF